METLRFKKDDFQFIKEKYPQLYKIYKNPYEKNGIVYVPLPSYDIYEKYSDETVGCIGDSLNEAHSDLNEDGLRLEAAWDYADWLED